MTSPGSGDVLSGWGGRLAAARVAASKTQQNLASTLGVALITIQRWEAGSRRPSEELQVELAKALGVPVTDLLPRDDAEAELPELVARLGGGCS